MENMESEMSSRFVEGLTLCSELNLAKDKHVNRFRWRWRIEIMRKNGYCLLEIKERKSQHQNWCVEYSDGNRIVSR